jgi:hypothetical protein
MRSTTSDRSLTFTSFDLKQILSKYQSADGREWGNEVFACPIHLVECIADITMLYRLHSHDQPFPTDVLVKAKLFYDHINLSRPKFGYCENSSYVVSAWYAGTQLYVIRLFRLHQHEETIFNAKILVNIVLSQARLIPNPSAWSYSSLWPLFQAALWLKGQAYGRERDWIRRFLDIMLRASGCKQFEVAAATLEMVWKADEYHDSITAGALTGSLMLG